MAGEVSERLRAYVRARVKPTGKAYQRGTAARLADFLAKRGFSEDQSWISAYADLEAKPRRHADIDVALTICDFFKVRLDDFKTATTPQPEPAVEAPQLSREAQKLVARIERLPDDLTGQAWLACHRAIGLMELGLGARAVQESAARSAPVKPQAIHKTSR